MANIIQAAQWLREEKKVKRSGWGVGIYYEAKNGYGKIYLQDILQPDEIETGYFVPGDLIADDWEIYA